MPAHRAITVRTFKATEFRTYRNLRLSALEESPNAFSSTLASEQSHTDDEWDSRLRVASNSGFDLPLIGYVGAKTAGLAWGKVDRSDSTIVNVYQMWVAPECRGHGLARLLLRTIIDWAVSMRARSVQLEVVCCDSSAMRLYVSDGFVPMEKVAPLRFDPVLMTQRMRRHIP